jgi:outer membrane protein OmpA-like peptidoglycan-associated protein
MRVRSVVISSLIPFLSAFPVTLAAAHPLDAERFKPAVTTDGWVNSEGSGVRSTSDPWELGLFLNYSRNSLITVDDDGELLHQYISGRLGVDLLASVTLADPFAIGLGLPLFLLQTGDDDPSFAGIGDLRIVPKLRILDDRESVGLALAVEVRAPTHSGDFSGGATNAVAIPKLIFDNRFRSGLRLGLNAGVSIRENTRFGPNVLGGDEFMYGLDLGFRPGGLEGKTELGIELFGGLGLQELDREEAPLEAFGFIRHEPSEEWEIIGGPALGLIAGYGVPILRGFIGVRYRPTSHDGDKDGVADADDQCPDVAEDRDSYQDHDGCPEEDPDEDRDGVPDHEDACPEQKETINGIDDEDGCPDTGDENVVFEDGQFKVLQTVEFEHGSAEIKQESHSLLDQVALHMKANPDVKKIRVEGHTDDTGPRDVNMRLSEKRAESVRKYLIDKGVSANRLKAVGHGPDRPLVDDDTPEARQKNRRVEFHVED